LAGLIDEPNQPDKKKKKLCLDWYRPDQLMNQIN